MFPRREGEATVHRMITRCNSRYSSPMSDVVGIRLRGDYASVTRQASCCFHNDYSIPSHLMCSLLLPWSWFWTSTCLENGFSIHVIALPLGLSLPKCSVLSSLDSWILFLTSIVSCSREWHSIHTVILKWNWRLRMLKSIGKRN